MLNLHGQMFNFANIYVPIDDKESNEFQNWMNEKLSNSQWLVCKNSHRVEL